MARMARMARMVFRRRFFHPCHPCYPWFSLCDIRGMPPCSQMVRLILEDGIRALSQRGSHPFRNHSNFQNKADTLRFCEKPGTGMGKKFTTDFTDGTDGFQRAMMVFRGRFFHPCHPCYPWFSLCEIRGMPPCSQMIRFILEDGITSPRPLQSRESRPVSRIPPA